MPRLLASLLALALSLAAAAQIAVRAETLYSMHGDPISDGVVLVRDGKIEAVGPASQVPIPEGYTVHRARVATPGLIDVRSTVGLTGLLNIPGHDQDQIERSAAIQPELRAEDAYNPHEPLVGYLREFGVTTVHSGHTFGNLMTGQTAIFKTAGNTVRDALVRPGVGIAATLGGLATASPNPGTRAKQLSLIRQALIDAQDYADKTGPARNLRQEALVDVLQGRTPLIVTAHKAQDIIAALGLQREFGIRVWLDGAAEAYLVLEEIRAAGVPVLLHPTMYRATGDAANLRLDTARVLADAGVPFAIQSGYEGYVPKVRVVLFEAALAYANGLTFEQALASITRDAARILGISHRVGSLQPGMDADIALFDGDPFEYLTRCTGVVLNGQFYLGED